MPHRGHTASNLSSALRRRLDPAFFLTAAFCLLAHRTTFFCLLKLGVPPSRRCERSYDHLRLDPHDPASCTAPLSILNNSLPLFVNNRFPDLLTCCAESTDRPHFPCQRRFSPFPHAARLLRAHACCHSLAGSAAAAHAIPRTMGGGGLWPASFSCLSAC